MKPKAYAAFLRGINVGGKNRLAMSELRSMFEQLGVLDPRTYIQSGNVVFQALPSLVKDLPDAFHQLLDGRIQPFPHVEIRSHAALRTVMEANPFDPETKSGKSVHIFFLSGMPLPARIEKLDQLLRPTERRHTVGRELYLEAPDGIGRSKFAQRVEKELGVTATARNLRTVLKVIDMFSA